MQEVRLPENPIFFLYTIGFEGKALPFYVGSLSLNDFLCGMQNVFDRT